MLWPTVASRKIFLLSILIPLYHDGYTLEPPELQANIYFRNKYTKTLIFIFIYNITKSLNEKNYIEKIII